MTTTKPLSPAMQKALDACPLRYTVWGGKHMGGLPKGVTISTVEALIARGLVSRRMDGAFNREVFRTIGNVAP